MENPFIIDTCQKFFAPAAQLDGYEFLKGKSFRGKHDPQNFRLRRYSTRRVITIQSPLPACQSTSAESHLPSLHTLRTPPSDSNRFSRTGFLSFESEGVFIHTITPYGHPLGLTEKFSRTGFMILSLRGGFLKYVKTVKNLQNFIFVFISLV